MSTRGLLLIALLLSGCRASEAKDSHFPEAHRDIAPIVSDRFSTEDARDRVGEAEEVMRLAGIKKGMWVADIGAGEGYYTVRLSPIVGPQGRVLAQDIVPETRDRLAMRVQRENLDNVAVRLGEPADPLLPPATFDRIMLVHMYHEVTEPYEFLWHLRDGLKPGGLIVVVDAYRPTRHHGMPPEQLKCEFSVVGLEEVGVPRDLAGSDAYFTMFRASKPKPRPEDMRACVPAQ